MNHLARRGFVSALALCALSVPIAACSQTQDEQQLIVYTTKLDTAKWAEKATVYRYGGQLLHGLWTASPNTRPI